MELWLQAPTAGNHSSQKSTGLAGLHGLIRAQVDVGPTSIVRGLFGARYFAVTDPISLPSRPRRPRSTLQTLARPIASRTRRLVKTRRKGRIIST